jgi:hypothetical protein
MSPAASRQLLTPSALLWASAFILAGLIVVQLGRSQAPVGGRGPDAALAAAFSTAAMGEGAISRVGEYTVMAFPTGSEDALAILDGRAEELFLYRVRGMSEFEFLGRDNLPQVFATARRLGPGHK